MHGSHQELADYLKPVVGLVEPAPELEYPSGLGASPVVMPLSSVLVFAGYRKVYETTSHSSSSSSYSSSSSSSEIIKVRRLNIADPLVVSTSLGGSSGSISISLSIK